MCLCVCLCVCVCACVRVCERDRERDRDMGAATDGHCVACVRQCVWHPAPTAWRSAVLRLVRRPLVRHRHLLYGRLRRLLSGHLAEQALHDARHRGGLHPPAHAGRRSDGAMGFHKSTIVARGANTQLDPSFVAAPLRTNVDLFACFAERLFKK